MCIRKCIFLFCLFCCSHLSGLEECSVLFVHIGQKFPPYLQTAIDQVKRFNQDTKVYVAGNQRAHKKGKLEQIIPVEIENLQMTNHHHFFSDACKYSGFWKVTTERFFIIEEVMAKYNLHNVVHLESDNMLYVNLDELAPTLINYNGIAAVFDNDIRCIPGFIFFRNVDSLQKMNEFLARNIRAYENDMFGLALFKNSGYADVIEHLPLVPREFVDACELVSINGDTTAYPDNYSNQIENFGSIFDGAAIGQYLGGVDPIFKMKQKNYINQSCLFNPSQWNFFWEKDQEGRKVPFMEFCGHTYRINNLHIHSKNLKKFTS